MNEETPVAPSPTVAQKRNHATMAGARNSDNDDNDGVPTFALPNQKSLPLSNVMRRGNGSAGNN
jgi:BRCT domain type II-containing protein